MKKWEIATIVVFFAVFILLLSSVELPWDSGEQPWQSKTSKIGEWVINDDFYVMIAYAPIIADSFLEHEAGACWKFVILEIFIANHANETRRFFAGRIEDGDGMVYLDCLEDPPKGPEGLSLIPDTVRCISIACKMPTNAVPEKFHYSIYNSDTWHGEILLKK
jgi:hypothetical protein